MEPPATPAGQVPDPGVVERGGLAGLLDRYRGRDQPSDVRALGITSMFQDIASDMVYPLLPAFIVALGGSAALFGVMESLADGVLAMLKGSVGSWSDRSGRRRPWIIAGYGGSAALRPLLAIATAPWHVIALRVGDRAAKGLRTAPRDAAIADAVPPARRAQAFAFHRGLDHLGAAIGPLVAALILWAAPGHVRLVFALATIPAFVGVAVVLARGPRDRATDARRASAQEAAANVDGAALVVDGPPSSRLRDIPPRLRLLLLAFVVFALGNASDGFLLLRLHDVGASAIAITLLWSAFHVVKYSTAVPAGRLADRIGHRRSIVIGWGVYAAAYAGFALSDSAWVVAVLLAPYALHASFSEGAERALVVTAGGRGVGRGTALGAFHLATGIGAVASSAVFGLVWTLVSAPAAFATGAALAAVATAMLLAGATAEDRA